MTIKADAAAKLLQFLSTEDWEIDYSTPSSGLIIRHQSGTEIEMQPDGTIGSAGSPVDVVAEDIYGPGGQGSGDSVAFESVETGSLVDKSSGNSYDVDGLNVPGWEEDGNSPRTDTSVTSSTFNFSDEYDLWLVVVDLNNPSSSGTEINLRANGDTTSNYSYTSTASDTVGDVSVKRVANIGAGASGFCKIMTTGRWSGRWRASIPRNRADDAQATGAENANVTGPLDSLTLNSNFDVDIAWQVYGRDIAAGGVGQ